MQAIVAVDEHWGIGYQGQLLVRIPADMKYFKQTTLGKVVIMGRETFDSMPGGDPLPERINIVLCEDRNFSDKDIIICTSLDELWDAIKIYPTQEVFVIGGASVYTQLLPYCRAAYVTKIAAEFPADKYFPNLDEAEGWEEVSSSAAAWHNGLAYRFTKYYNHRVLNTIR